MPHLRTLLAPTAVVAALSFTPAARAAPRSAVPLAAPVAAATDAETLALLRTMLTDYRRYAEGLWHAAPDDPARGYWGSGKGEGGNEGVRAIANTALVYAMLWREGDRTFAVADRVEPALRYAAAIHDTGDRKGTDSKTWGHSWQSAMWAGNLGVAAWLVRDQLKPETRVAVARVVAAEADRLIGHAPPTMAPGDTKAEENAWDLTAASAALLLMPGHAHAKDWHDAVLRYGFNTLSVEADKTSPKMADGRPLRDWVTTTQVYPDYTLENHGFFHPVYAMVAPATLTQAAVAYRLAGRPVPDALKHNVLHGWNTLRYVALPDGEWLYPQGLDWDFHDFEHLHYWSLLATLYRDPAAAVLEQRTARQARRRQQINGNGSFVGPTGSLGFAREAVQAERVAFALLMHQQFGAPPAANEAAWGRLTAGLAPARAFEGSGFVVHRAARGLLSFSWKNRLMGLAAPDSGAYLDAPFVTTPHTESLAGRFRLEGQSAGEANRFTVNGYAVRADKGGFVAVVDAGVNNGRLRQRMVTASVAPGVLIYLDRVTANGDVTVAEERGLVVGVENDEVSGNRRRVFSGANGGIPLTVTGGEAATHEIAGTWANVDGRLGLVSALPDARLVYRAAGKHNRAGAREDLLFAQPSATASAVPRTYKLGETVSRRAGLLLPNATPEETARVAATVRMEDGGNGAVILRFVGPDGRAHALTFAADGSARWGGEMLYPVAPKGR